LRSLEQSSEDPASKKVFIGGSRSLSRLSKQIKQRLDNMIERRLTIVVGDANGVDKAVQRHLANRSYGNIIVFCMADICRNNIGKWPTHEVRAPQGGRRDAAFFSVKDRAMGAEADYGLMLWDGKSRGTLANIKDLVERQKPVVVYFAPDKSFLTLRRYEELSELLGKHSPTPPLHVSSASHGRQSARNAAHTYDSTRL